jgi:hypothetical protein
MFIVKYSAMKQQGVFHDKCFRQRLDRKSKEIKL